MNLSRSPFFPLNLLKNLALLLVFSCWTDAQHPVYTQRNISNKHNEKNFFKKKRHLPRFLPSSKCRNLLSSLFWVEERRKEEKEKLVERFSGYGHIRHCAVFRWA
ncbi:hypothetical protein PSV09DRAFT_2281627 [Bipolaris maydis]|uniref:uncharacterized protein n=1 Tax=Cochliobolus heterostrophus TaxID=5016 RepID=UPI0024DBA802|nr:hypothetical protein J3E73DRAFT_272639 [Bipolaris maydis]KAJ5064913.1 hypothetical protein J3E74DRAFT_297918 [Bipolaris maydis]KAJ6214048.1 hypothetical protein PSV09DRAFT_2281627 [Bipolaris maydis]KAJ6275250.1 hypothetical protein PSV08DRAFT_270976 [Bipolaris maydis]KAJ6285460.1 hypothetical protein J3E71DRAFT_255332 [Bipolaris maydis]